ncbi:Ubx4p SCDLUD_003103 [Saccharomycodes ludwigii]|uniref:Ubx4p n=1 Tax=Saccharomycodes ludwigii TaxID=36035 RepID=UPI001E8AB4C8|nr:hypothetical protein SCDLUD_003103 [Saccharomycodes ludwigii]KAH3900135.1 hypothetical protein SCDLUD_003103 [Saccharomycodes ludwigii]
MSISVEYQFRTFKPTITPGSTLNDVLRQTLNHFKLSSSIKGDQEEWALSTQQQKDNVKPLDLNIPLRYLNLPQGCKLLLHKVEKPSTKNGDYNTFFKLKFQIITTSIGGGANNSTKTKILKTNKNEKVLDVLIKHIDNDLLHKENFKLQVFNKVFEKNDITNMTTFEDINVMEDMMIRLSIIGKDNKTEDTTINATTNNIRDPTPNATTNTIDNKHNKIEKKHVVQEKGKEEKNMVQLHQPVLYEPSEHPQVEISKIIEENDNAMDYTLDVDDVKKYQKMLNKMANSNRTSHDLKNSVKKITTCEVRVRFPDRSFLSSFFKPDESAHELYEFVRKTLLSFELEFELYLSHPYTKIPDDFNLKLVDDLKFESKTMVVLLSKSSGPYFKSDIEVKSLNIQDNNNGYSKHEDTKTSNVPLLGKNAQHAEPIIGDTKEPNNNNNNNNNNKKDIAKNKHDIQKKMSKFLRLSKK